MKKSNILPIGMFIAFFVSLFSTYIIGGDDGPVFLLSQNYLRYFIYGIVFISFIAHSFFNGVILKRERFYFVLFVFSTLTILQLLRREFFINDYLRFIILIPFLFINTISRTFFKPVRVLLILVIANSFLLSFLQGFTDEGRFIFNSDDSNFSAIYFVILFMLAERLKLKYFKFIFIALGVLTASRNFILAILVFYLIKIVKNYACFSKLLLVVKPFVSYLILNILIFILGFWLLLSFENVRGRDTFSLNDGSNRLRFIEFSEGILFLVSDKDALIQGAGENYWSIQKGGTGEAGTSGALHNTLLDLFVVKGLYYGLLNIIFIFSIIHSKWKYSNLEYIYCFMVTTLLLGSLFSGIFIYCWCFILMIEDKESFFIKTVNCL